MTAIFILLLMAMVFLVIAHQVAVFMLKVGFGLVLSAVVLLMLMMVGC